MKILLVAAALFMLNGCAVIDSFAGFLGPGYLDAVAEAEDAVTDEVSQRYEDLCDLVPQEDIDHFFAEVNQSMDLRSDGTKPIVGSVDCAL